MPWPLKVFSYGIAYVLDNDYSPPSLLFANNETMVSPLSKLYNELAIFQTYLSNETLIADNHVYLNDHQSQFMSVDVEMYSPYYTCRDHDGLLTTLIPSRKR